MPPALLIPVDGSAAHDTWVQTNTSIVREGDAVYVDLMLGNHGNEHRDFKLASKIDPAKCTLDIIAPSGKSYDLKDRLVDTGYAPKEGFWSGKFVPQEPGEYMVAHTALGGHGATRGIKSGKTFFLSGDVDKLAAVTASASKPLGHPLELVPQASTVATMGPGKPISVQLLLRGQPLKGARVSFVPRGVTLAEGFDDEYERMTDEAGKASYTPREGNYVLVVAHHAAPDEKGPGYDKTNYSATLTVLVPEACPCCE